MQSGANQVKGRTKRFQAFLKSLPGGDLTVAQKRKIENHARKKARGWSRNWKGTL